ncbi:MAG: ATP-binding protein [Nocardioides sp.]
MMTETLDSSAPQQRRSWDVAEWPVVRKVALVLALPLLLAVVLGGMRVHSELAQASAATATSSQVTVLGPAVAYLSAAEDASIVFQTTDDEPLRAEALKAVNDEASRLESAWDGADLSASQRAQVRALLDNTQGLRDGSAYAIVATAFNQLERLEAEVTLGIAAMTDAGTRTESLINLVGQLNEGRLAVTEQQLLLVSKPSIIPKNELYGHLGVESAAIGNLELLLPDDDSVKALREYNGTNTGLLGIGTPELKGEQPLRLYDELTTDLLGQVESTLAADATASNRTALLTAALVGLALLVAVGLALIVSRILVRPILRVRDGALAVAHEQLPETVRRIRAGQQPGDIVPIPVTTHEEMGQLARAVDDLHGTAVRLAQDEAELRSRVGDMFVTLSRRNTSLVNQQLRLIEDLERDEEDPRRLESLFHLDHLASRMRRTAESLVVLADAPTQHSEQDALSVDEALQAATAGVQDYQRVRVSGAPSLRISGAAAPDVVHLFTELIDNALSYSPPTAPVTVTAEEAAGLVLVEIEDHGLGIDPATMTELNETLRGGADVTVDTARRMGLFVVARLARRHGLTVTLDRNAEGGTTAKVYLARPLLSGRDGGPVEAPTESPDVAADSAPADEPVVLGDTAFRRPDPGPDPEPMTDPAHGHEHEHVVEVEVEDAPDAAVPAALTPVPASAIRGNAPSTNGTVPATKGSGSPLDALSAVINANIGLPQREPGTAPQPSPLSSLLAQRTVSRAPAPIPGEGIEPAPEQVVPDAWEDEVAVPGSPDAEVLAPVGELPAPVPLEPPVTGPPSPLDVDSSAYSLDGPVEDDETPLFRLLRSGWFAASGDERGWDTGGADAGWQAADRVSEAAAARLTPSGLPVRDPGNRLVPGGVDRAAPVARRDPEAIKARLAAHAAGVARGRSAASDQCAPAAAQREDVNP